MARETPKLRLGGFCVFRQHCYTFDIARDKYHYAARIALEKDAWIVTNDPLELSFKQADFEIDLAAERLIAAERGLEKIAVEIKSFLGKSAISEFHTTLSISTKSFRF